MPDCTLSISAATDTSPGWKAAAKILTESMNETANPCVDFFEFACGQWNKKHPIPKGAGG